MLEIITQYFTDVKVNVKLFDANYVKVVTVYLGCIDKMSFFVYNVITNVDLSTKRNLHIDIRRT